MDKNEISIFLVLWIFTLVSVLIFHVNGWKIEFVTFFFFAFFYITQSINKIYKGYENVSQNNVSKVKNKIRIISCSIFALTLFMIGIVHILGDLNFLQKSVNFFCQKPAAFKIFILFLHRFLDDGPEICIEITICRCSSVGQSS